ncbi:MAG: dTDP-4-dehydrorhamnose 3,5-epimerase [Candidatus Firestonebacteria bacterium RIFOXYA2_FULL_40_8]|nr:MAG: dTDP-4-dehydrorhamnose 3,5-epimerase [Candidatus Firestonebacteria bacterium RIFOXYA2_FULL_40_8]
MKIIDTNINGVFVVKIDVPRDERGYFQKVFNYDIYKKFNLDTDFKEHYFSNSVKNVIRGLHFQLPPYQCTKIVYVSSGSIIDVAIDLRQKSSTFGRIFSRQLDCLTGEFMYLPKGIAHGFKSLENNTVVNYIQNSCYSKKHDMGILFSSVKFDWGVENHIVSERDNAFITFEEFKKRNPF